ncbi:hypothetical protein DXG03_002687 [Asterophora parasitica]|uniref:FYVE-type domain-containing protein n=1 Tax=Asterophora parasitica TaxID=117018 RepID=A0A9P7G9U4_9AGAR|nr:hypothetical protein DXG03_002687 [Asterophora parasitica]
MADSVPYQAYRTDTQRAQSKRHSNVEEQRRRSSPNPVVAPLHESDSVSSSPSAAPSSSAVAASNGRLSPVIHVEHKSPTSSAAPSSSAVAASNGRLSPVIHVEHKSPTSSAAPSAPAFAASNVEHKSPTSLAAPSAPAFAGRLSPVIHVEHDLPSPPISASSPPSAGPSALPSPQLSDAKPLPTKKPSTFRRVPLRSPRSSHPASPLGPNHSSPSHSRNVSVSSVTLLPPQLDAPVARSPPVHSDPPSRRTPPAQVSLDHPAPTTPVYDPSSERQASSPDPAAIQLTKSTSSTPTTHTPPPPLQQDTLPPSRPDSQPQRTQAPYRPGFQPKGLYRPLTDDFLALRRLKREGEGVDGRRAGMKRVERTKLLRRLEKLVDLHFSTVSPDTTLAEKTRSGPGVRGGAHQRRASSLFDFDIRNLNISDAGGLWRGVVGGGEANDIRSAEQRITPWQDDADVATCPLCTTSFHPLTNRKHHCRLCGQIICSLPVKRPHRPAPCSILFVVDPQTRKIEEVGEGVDYGVRRRRLDSNNGVPGNGAKGGQGHVEEDKFLKGVRICRTCRPILLRQQYEQEIVHVPTISKLYDALVALEQEIEDALPQFQELVLTLSHDDQPTKEASATRKRLLEAFAQYDALAKRIRKLPCPNGPGSSQDRVQTSIMIRASQFLQKNMFPLQSLPTPKKAAPPSTKHPSNAPSQDAQHHLDPDSKMALALQPLLEQEALLESFVEEAKAHRKFEDVKTLKTNLREIRLEIEKIVANAEGGMQGDGSV